MTIPAWMQRLQQPKSNKPKLTKAETKALRWYNPTGDDLEHDCREMVMTTCDILIGALIEPGRMPDQWCRYQIRTRLQNGSIRRLTTINYLKNAQKQPNAFFFLMASWKDFQHAEDLLDADRKAGVAVGEMDWNAETISNV